MNDPFQARTALSIGDQSFQYYSLSALEEKGICQLKKLPFSIRVLLESVLRNCDGFSVTESDVKNLAGWSKETVRSGIEVPFKPARVILQDFTGVPAVVDLAALRSAMARLGGDPKKINPLIPVDLVIDHSIQTDYYGTHDAAQKNQNLEFERNAERYSLLHWAQESLDNFRAVPPSVGIIHQVNLEYLARVVMNGEAGADPSVLYPDSVVGTDSHTVMIGGLGVLGWGVGGIEAEAVMLGQPYYMLAPEVIGFELIGKLRPGVTATDLVLTVTQLLRKEGVVGKFVEYFGAGAESMPVADRAVLANMAPEYGATIGFFPVDEKTLTYLSETGRTPCQVARIEAFCKAQSLFRTTDSQIPEYTKVLQLDLSTVEPSLAGPKRPQDRVSLVSMKSSFEKSLLSPISERGFALSETERQVRGVVQFDNGKTAEIGHGAVVIASITSCTNTSNPTLLITAGLLARNAVKKGLSVKPYVKTSFGPGSRVVIDYLKKANLLCDLETLGFNIVGFGCLSCIGNSGPLPEAVAKVVNEKNLCVSAVLSGNRNFEGRVNPLVKANYLASPALVIAYALAGSTDRDLTTEPLGFDPDGNPVMLCDIWPTETEITETVKKSVLPEMYAQRYADVYNANKAWNAIATTPSELFSWDENSTYIQEPPFLSEMTIEAIQPGAINQARALLLLGDSVTTDHISPAGAIKKDSPAGCYLMDHSVVPEKFNSYGSRRGNDRVMTRGTFANIRIRNLLAPGTEGGWTKFFGKNASEGPVMPVYDAALRYAQEKTPLVVLAGAEYGTGSSRDWAAKGTALLGVKAVIAKSFERIHRGNLVGMGLLPLEFTDGESIESLGLDGTERFTIPALPDDFTPRAELTVTAEKCDGTLSQFKVRVRIDTPVEIDYYRQGGILPSVIRQMLS